MGGFSGLRPASCSPVRGCTSRPVSYTHLKTATVSRTPTGKYFCSLMFEYAVRPPQATKPTRATTPVSYTHLDVYKRQGARFYAGYPITPSSEIMEYLSWRMDEVGGAFIQAESELAGINMVIGASACGVRALTASSGPGISLKQEGISTPVSYTHLCAFLQSHSCLSSSLHTISVSGLPPNRPGRWN